MPAYNFRSLGAVSYLTSVGALSPGAPAGKQNGDLLTLYTFTRQSGQTVSGLTGWDTLYFDNSGSVNFSVGIYARIADGTSADTPSPTWTGTTADSAAFIEARSGDVFSPASSIVAHTATLETSNQVSDLLLPSLTITDDNTLVIGLGLKYKTSVDDGATITAPGGMTKRAEHAEDGNGAMMFATCDQQQTTASNYGGANFTSTATESNPSYGIVLALKTASVVAPAFDTSPTVSAQTTDTYTLSYDADANATDIYVGAYLKDATAPTAAELKAGTNAVATASEATTGSADTIDLAIPGGDPFPVYDLYAVLEGAGGFSSVVALVDEALDDAAGYSRVTVAGLPPPADSISVLDDADPAVLDGDILVYKTTADSFDLGADAHDVTMDANGTFSISPGTDESRLVVSSRVYHVALGAWSDASFVSTYVNNQPTEYAALSTEFLVEQGSAITPISLLALGADDEGDTFTAEIVGTLPDGLSVNGSSEIEGTPTAYERATVTVRFTYEAGDVSDFDITITTGLVLPDATTLGLDALEVASLSVVEGPSELNDDVEAGTVLSMEPSEGTLVPYDQEVTVVLSTASPSIVWTTRPHPTSSWTLK